MLEDIAILTGGTLISTQKGMKLDKLTIDMLGSARNVVVESGKTTIVDGAGNQEDIKARFEVLQDQHGNRCERDPHF